MHRKQHFLEQIIAKLREAEVKLSKGSSIPLVCRKIGVKKHINYRWRKEYGGLRLDQAKLLKQREKENARLKKDVAERTLENAILKRAFEKIPDDNENYNQLNIDNFWIATLAGTDLKTTPCQFIILVT